jgi:hypothetical protein
VEGQVMQRINIYINELQIIIAALQHKSHYRVKAIQDIHLDWHNTKDYKQYALAEEECLQQERLLTSRFEGILHQEIEKLIKKENNDANATTND